MGRHLGSKNKSGKGKFVRDAGDGPARAATQTLVLSLVKRSNEAKTRMQGISGELGAEIKGAVENKHVDAGALKLIAKCARMDELKRVAFLAAFDLYRDYAQNGGLFGDEHVGDLLEGDPWPEATAAGDGRTEAAPLGDVVADNVRKLRRGIKKTSEGAEGDRLGASDMEVAATAE